MPLKLFAELYLFTKFHFYGNPERKLIKSDESHYIDQIGRHKISPTVAVVEDLREPSTQPRKSIFDLTKGDSDDRSTGG